MVNRVVRLFGMAVMTIGDLLLVLAVWTRFFGEPENRRLGLLFLGFITPASKH